MYIKENIKWYVIDHNLVKKTPSSEKIIDKSIRMLLVSKGSANTIPPRNIEQEYLNEKLKFDRIKKLKQIKMNI